MPVPRKDPNTGAIIFDLTADEQATQATREELNGLKAELEHKSIQMDEKLKLLDNVLGNLGIS